MESEEPGGFLPAHFPTPAPKLVLSRPGTQQLENDAEGYKNHPLPQQFIPIPYPSNSYYIERTGIEQDGRSAHAQPAIQVDGRSSHVHVKGYRDPAAIGSGGYQDLNHVYPLPLYAPLPLPVYKPAYESKGLYGVYIQPESLARSYAGYPQKRDTEAGHYDATGSGGSGLRSRANISNAHTASRHGPLPLALPEPVSSTGTPSTPVLYRMSAKRPPGDQSYIPAPQLESCLKKDLSGNIIITLPTFFLDELWPVSALPCPLDEHTIFKVLTHNKVWNNIQDCFVTPPTSLTELHMAEWLNKLGGLIGAFTGSGFERKRSWSTSTHSRQPGGASINRKPDLVLVDKSFVDKLPEGTPRPHISWTHIHTFAEVTRSYPFPKRISSTINDKSYLLFVSQHDRRFVPALSFNGQALFALTLTDRQGQISMPPIPFLHGKANAFMFMKILTFLMYGPIHNTGRDTTMELHPDGHVKSISVNKHWYNVVYLIYSLQSMVGRGTTVWLVSRNGNYYILKDSWIQDSRVESEITFLQKLKDDPKLKNHVPDLIEGEDVCISGAVDSTGRYREQIGGMHKSRSHRRLVMTPFGKQITTFKSKSEFIGAIIDIIEGK